MVCSICRVRRQEIVNFMTPLPISKGGNFGVKNVKLMYFFKKLCEALFSQTLRIVMMANEGSTKIVNYINPGAGVLVLGRDHISYIVKIIFYSINIQNIDCYCIKGLWRAFLCYFFLFYYDVLLICKYEPFRQEVSVESLILRWPLNPMGLLFSNK